MDKQRVIVSVISDLVTDQRVHKLSMYLHQKGYEVLLVGRMFNNSLVLEKRNYTTRRLQCHFRKGVLQYLEWQIRLFFFLLFRKSDVYVANDLDTLLPNFLIAKARARKLVYDSHEYFTGMQGMEQKPLKQKTWKLLEKLLLPKTKYALTVNDSIAELYKKEYGIDMKVVRNVPFCDVPQSLANPVINLPENSFKLILQSGGLHAGRGGEEIVRAMKILPHHFHLVMIGGGEIWEDLIALSKGLGIQHKISFITKIPFQTLQQYTSMAHLGLSLEIADCVSFQLSLPNKLFDYIRAGIPVLASDVVEVRRIVERYNIGKTIQHVTPSNIAQAVLEIAHNKDEYELWKKNTTLAAKEFCWENEAKVLDDFF